jgi:hypothetical protein
MSSLMRWAAAACFAVLIVGMADEASGQRRANRGWRMYGTSRPWFANAGVRRQLKLDDNAYNTLNKTYVQYWTPYNQAVVGLPADLDEQQRQQRIAAAYGTFNTGFNKASAQVFTDPDVRDRYNQLNLQYQGYGAFNDPTVQTRLKLNDQQRQTFNRYYNDWNTQMNNYATEYATNPDAVNKQWADNWKQTRERINTTLTPDQRKTWEEMAGEPYDFPADAYFADDDAGRDGGAARGDRRDDAGRDAPPRANPPRDNRDNPPRANPPRDTRDNPPRDNPRDNPPRDNRDNPPRDNPPPKNPR